MNIQQILGVLANGSAVLFQHYSSTELKQKTTKPNWWASKEKCPWSHLNQSFLQAGFSLIWGSALLHILIVFPWSATMTPQMFIQARLGKGSARSRLRYAVFTYNIHKSDSDLWFIEYAFAVLYSYCAVYEWEVSHLWYLTSESMHVKGVLLLAGGYNYNKCKVDSFDGGI